MSNWKDYLENLVVGFMFVIAITFVISIVNSFNEIGNYNGKVYTVNGKYLGEFYNSDDNCVWYKEKGTINKICGNFIVKYEKAEK